ncbi:MAG: ATP-binding protein [Lachnospiraceae bacterium]|nr:ATP-binding protein [Lachnospiraceae bacterium]
MIMGLTNSQYNRIMREYSARQLKASRELQARKEEAYRAIPLLGQLSAQTASSAVAAVRSCLFGQDCSVPDFSSNEKKRRSALVEAGYPADYLEMHYTCPDCQDTGYIGGEKCHCFRKLALELFYEQTDLADDAVDFSQFSLAHYPDEPFSAANPKTIREQMAVVLAACLQFVREFDHSDRNLLFFGKAGLGKTFLSRCIAKELTQSLHSVVYYSSPDLFSFLADITFSKKGTTHSSDLTFITECDLLIIDDLGTELTNDFVRSMLFNILTDRKTAGKSTLISTNLEPSELAPVYNDRISSRITSGFKMLGFYGNDIRNSIALSGATPRT